MNSDLPELRDHIRERRAALAGFMEQSATWGSQGDLLRVIPRKDIYICYLNDNRAPIGELASDLYGRELRVEVSLNGNGAAPSAQAKADAAPRPPSKLSCAIAYARHGMAVFPLHSIESDGECSCGKLQCSSAGKHPRLSDWQKLATCDEAQIAAWWKQWPDANISVKCGHDSDLTVLDVDGDAGQETLRGLEVEHGELPETPIAITGKGGAHYYFKFEPDVLGKARFAPGLDFRTEGNYVVGVGSSTKRRYEWEAAFTLGDIQPARMPRWLAELSPKAKPRAESQSHEPVSIEQAEEMLKYVDSDDRETWLRAAMSVKNEFGQSGRPLWDVYSQRSAKYDPADQEKTWNSIDGDGGITIATLIMEAKRGGWAPPGARNARGDSGNANGTYRGDGEGAGHSGNASAEQGTPRTPWPAALDEAASHGPAGEFVKLVLPHTEADPAALLIQFLVAIGCIIGRKLYRIAEAAEHYPNFFACTVGKTGHGRKGSAWAQVARLLRLLTSDAPDIGVPIQSGLTSGEGLIYAVRDAVERTEKVNEKGKPTAYQTVQVDDGVSDKRLLVVETEFAKVLRIAERDGNVLSPVIRRAWDTGDLQTLSKNSPLKATGAHVSIVGHITEEELLRCLTSTEAANGGANRYLWHCAKRSKFLPRGGHLNDGDFGRLVVILKAVFEWAGAPREMGMSKAAWQIWEEVYEELSSGRPGLLGALLSRAEAQVLRLSILYAALDRAGQIEPAHLKAALAVWEYCEASVEYIFGDQLGDPDADAILSALRTNEDGLSRTDIRDIFARNLSAGRIERALDVLRRANLATVTRATTGGRPAEIWRAVVTTKTTKTTKGGYSTGAA